jgi:hypothetical protein
MKVQLKGTIKVIFATEKINDKLSKKQIVVTVDEDTQYPQDIICDAVNNKIDLIDSKYKMGDAVIVQIDLRGKENKGKYYNQISLMDISKQ